MYSQVSPEGAVLREPCLALLPTLIQECPGDVGCTLGHLLTRLLPLLTTIHCCFLPKLLTLMTAKWCISNATIPSTFIG